MDWQARYYPLDVFVTLRKKIEDLIKSGDFRAVELVKDETDSVGTPDLKSWASSHKNLFVPLAPEVQLEGASIEAKYPDLIDAKSPYQSADAYVIAWARLQGGVVISQETSVHEKRNPAKRHYIPDVCRDLGMPCINLLGLMRREKWTF
ncbi:MAG: hypothetical protein DME55_14935 [Verrucomicrobia bacterium]|nr:MAG: hypothetical protein DME55_14935 [Verrucomicrobiota bacterium]